MRIFDFSWFLASAGGTRLCAALGADVIKVEWKENPDTRLAAMAPVGGREARQRPQRRCRASRIPIWAASSTTRMPARAAFRSISATRRGWRSPGA
ncbi:CoA transferase [Pseudoroseomonas wenyumeiae]